MSPQPVQRTAPLSRSVSTAVPPGKTPWPARLHVLPHLGQDAVPPALIHRLLVVLLERSLHRGVRPVLAVPALLVAVLLVPEERGRDHIAKAADPATGAHLPLPVHDHLIRHRGVVGAEEAAGGPALPARVS